MVARKGATTRKKKEAPVVEPAQEKQPELGFITGTDAPRTRKKVAIVGFAPSSMTDVRSLFDDKDFEIWGLNQLYMVFPHLPKYATRWFQIHNKSDYEQAVRDHSHEDWLANPSYVDPQTGKKHPLDHQLPVYMQTHIDKVPLSIPFPVAGIMRQLGDYFTNSISWMIALAICEGFEAIHIYGVDMAQDEEYAEQRPSCEYFIGFARGMGIKVFIPAQADLCKTLWLYPFEDHKPFKIKLEKRKIELRQRAGQLNAEEMAAHDGRMQVLGALENMNYIHRNWMCNAQDQAIDKDHLARMEGVEPKCEK